MQISFAPFSLNIVKFWYMLNVIKIVVTNNQNHLK